MDAGIISSIKSRYRQFKYEQELDNIDANVGYIQKVDQLSAMKALRNICREILNSVFWNFWLHTKPMDGACMGRALDEEERDLATQVTDMVNQLLPATMRGFSISSILNPAEDNDCIDSPNVSVLAADDVKNIFGIQDAEEAEDTNDEFIEKLSMEDKLRCIVLTKRLMKSEDDIPSSVANALRHFHCILKLRKVASIPQSHITDFFSN